MLLLLFSGVGSGSLPVVTATVRIPLHPDEAQFLATGFPQYVKTNGTSFPVVGLAYDATIDEAAFWKFAAAFYGSGDVALDIYWYADTATSANVVWEVQFATITADVDTQDIETKAFATPSFVQDAHLGTTGQRLHKATVILSNTDGLAAGDLCHVRIARDADSSNATDDLAGDAILVLAEVAYSDT